MSNRELKTMSLVQRLWQRRFFHIVGAYLAGGWIALELVDHLVDRSYLPELVYRLTLLWYLAGLFAAVLIAWHHGAKGRQRAPRSELAALAVLGVAVLGLSASTAFSYTAERSALAAALASRLDLQRVAVLYFEDLSPGEELAAVADGLTESMIVELSAVKGLHVLSRGAVLPYRRSAVQPDQVGRGLGAGTLVSGTVERIGDRVRICFRLLDGESGVEFQRASFDVGPDDLLAAQDTLVAGAARMLREWLGAEVRLRTSRRGTSDMAAWLFYQRAERLRKDGEAALLVGDGAVAGGLFEAADSLLASALRADGGWPEPAALRGFLAYRRARVADSLDERLRWVELGLARVAPALTLQANHPWALEVRGTLKYWLWLQGAEPDPDRADALFLAARADLEQAVRVDPAQASAHGTLSHLYLNAPDLPAAVLAARRAYEEDAYLENADAVIWRLVTSSYNLEQFTEMQRWCEVGQRRFPDHYRFVSCQLQLMTTPGVTPDVELAWSLLGRLDGLLPTYDAAFERLRGELAIAAVLARAGLPDSASAVVDRVHASLSPVVDPERELYRMEAYVRTFLGDFDRAADLLRLDAALHPGGVDERHWWWRELRSHPRWRDVVGGRVTGGR